MSQKSPEQRIERQIEFLGEKDGPSERELKARLVEWLAGDRHVSHAYLALLGFRPADERSVGLCLVSSKPNDMSVVRGTHAVFHKLFDQSQHLDVVFVSEAQHEDLKRVCQPFFERST